MYDLPEGTSFDFLKGRELELLCFGPYTVTLHFDKGRLQIEGIFRHLIAHHAKPMKSSFPLLSSKLMRLLGKQVTKVDAERDGTLTLGFSNDDVLVVYGNVGPYESYQVYPPGGGLIVV